MSTTNLLGGNPPDHTSGVTFLPTTTGLGAPPSTTSSSPLFVGPTPTGSGNWPKDAGPGPSVYYYVLLGVLLTLIILAGSLTYRTYRMRRRYRTATQLAIARGDPIPAPTWWGTERTADPWGLGFSRTRSTRPKKWVRIPTLWDVAGSDKQQDEKEVDGWIGQPLTVHSALPDSEPVQSTRSQAQSHSQSTPRGRTVGGIRRYWTAEEQRLHESTRERAPSPPPVQTQELTAGEPVRIAFVVQMPVEAEKDRVPSTRTGMSDEDDVGWRPGMEIGLWEGVVEETSGYPVRASHDQRSGYSRAEQRDSQPSDISDPPRAHSAWRDIQ